MLDYSPNSLHFPTQTYKPLLKPWDWMGIPLKLLIQMLKQMQGTCTLHGRTSWRPLGAPSSPAHEYQRGEAHMEGVELRPRAPICPGQVWLSHNFGARQVCLQMGN